LAKEVVHQRGLAIRLACAVFSISESCYRYEPKQDAENETLFQPATAAFRAAIKFLCDKTSE
jgi:hypothetical protein